MIEYPKKIGRISCSRNKYLNNIIEQDHRFIKLIVKYASGFKSFNTAKYILSGIEKMNMIRKGQVDGLDWNVLLECELFGIRG